MTREELPSSSTLLAAADVASTVDAYLQAAAPIIYQAGLDEAARRLGVLAGTELWRRLTGDES